MKYLSVLAFLLVGYSLCAQKPYWHFAADEGIQWNVQKNQSHTDHIEMSGQQISAIIRYGVDTAGHLQLSRKLVFPMLRTIPNDTRGSLIQVFQENIIDSIKVNQESVRESAESFYINGSLQTSGYLVNNLKVDRNAFASAGKAAYIESYVLTNNRSEAVSVDIPLVDKDHFTDAEKGVYGSYIVNYKVFNGGQITIPARSKYVFWLVISARKAVDQPYYFSASFEWEKRLALLNELQHKLVLRTPNDTINRMFSFAKIRAAESIFDTRAGLMHGPGGGDYYAGIWANDQAEYINPFFAYLGNAAGLESARNSFRLFATYMNQDFKPIPSSIIAEGAGYWNGAGDRGDQAMIGYGASLFALTHADTIEANTLWPLINWCNEYLIRQKTAEGVIASASDELEGRFPAGKINLSTNVLAYASFWYGARLASALCKKPEAAAWRIEADQLKTRIEEYFGATIEGYKTYRYFDGNDKLRSWICLPLVMDINDRREQTIKALLSDRLWTKNGLLTESGSSTFWDRSTLYAFRGLFKAGATDTCLSYFAYYSAERLLGAHVPYAIEAWPEGDQRHLSAESGLYCRAITEGLFGFNPIGFNEFMICPKLPNGWKEMSLNRISVCNKLVDIKVQRIAGKYRITILADGKSAKIISWNGLNPVSVVI
jgi:hypothetical protein